MRLATITGLATPEGAVWHGVGKDEVRHQSGRVTTAQLQVVKDLDWVVRERAMLQHMAKFLQHRLAGTVPE